MPATDPFSSNFRTVPRYEHNNAETITPSDTVELTYITRGIYVGVGGNVKVTLKESGTVTFVGVPTGTILPIRAKLVFSIGTTALNLIALW